MAQVHSPATDAYLVALCQLQESTCAGSDKAVSAVPGLARGATNEALGEPSGDDFEGEAGDVAVVIPWVRPLQPRDAALALIERFVGHKQ